MLLLIMVFRITLTINIIIVLNNIDYKWIINEFLKNKNRQYFNNYEELIFFIYLGY